MELKHPHSPRELPAHVPAAVRFYFQFNHLKNLYRQGWLQAGIPAQRCESVAEHSLGVALLCMLLADTYFPHLDSERVLRMALVHDLGEVYAGDLTPEDGVDREHKHRLEQASIERLLAGLPGGDDYLELWREFEDSDSPEAAFVRQIDRLEMGLQAAVYSADFPELSSRFSDSARNALSSPELLGIMDAVDRLREG